MLRRLAPVLLGVTCSLVLLLVSFRRVLFEDGQFVHFDAAFFYHPLYLRVQQEWAAGRWPLWDPGQNGGTPLLGNPVAAVLYPGKVLYAFFPYAWGNRLYVIAHTLLALLGMVALGRSLGISLAGSLLAGLGYGFGAPVLLLHGNVIFLVGAVWLPWGLHAVDRLLRLRRRSGLAELSLVLALQVLGGDPESAYLTVAAGAGYAFLLAAGRRPAPASWPWQGLRRLGAWPTTVAVMAGWVAVTLGLAWAHPSLPAWMPPARLLVLPAWGAFFVYLATQWRRSPGEARLAPMIAGLASAGGLAAALAAIQLLPVLEFALRSARVGEDVGLDVYRFSFEPYRLCELLWPNLLGTLGPENRAWLQALCPSGDREPWIPTVYMGGLILVLALSTARLRDVPPWQAWLTLVAALALAASLGKFASPLWWARWLPASGLGPHDSSDIEAGTSGFPGDGTGSPYAIVAALLPGFTVFRYPNKLLPLFAAAMAALAGAGWDRLRDGPPGRPWRLLQAGLGTSLLGLLLTWFFRARALAYLSRHALSDPLYGPLEGAGAWTELERSLVHGAVVLAAGLVVVARARRHFASASVFAVLLLTADLAVAGGRLIRTAPEADFEAEPEAARQIAAAERSDPASSPFRIQRMSNWLPPAFGLKGAPDRFHEGLVWDRATLHPLHGLPLGIEYCATQGILELDDYVLFLESGLVPLPSATARLLGVPPGQRVRYHPRRAFDLWGARYFILPTFAGDWASEARGMASFLPETELVYPAAATLNARDDAAGKPLWSARHDWQLRRNRAAYPRAWLVHHARLRPPAVSLAERRELMRLLLFQDDPIWTDPSQPVLDLHSTAVVETDTADAEHLRGYLARLPVEPGESVRVVAHNPQRVELSAVLNRPGLVILADTFYPGWRLTIDGKPAAIYRTNRLMRGAAVPSGRHTLVYTFEPQSFRIGACISSVGIALLGVLVAKDAWANRSESVRNPSFRPEAGGGQ